MARPTRSTSFYRRVPSPTRWDRLHTFIQTPAGLAVVGALLTTLVSGPIANTFKSIDDERQQAAQATTSRRNDLVHLRSLMDSALFNRAVIDQAVVDTLRRDHAESDLVELWPRYEKAVFDSSALFWQTGRDLESKLTVKDGDNPVFLNYLLSNISPKLDEQNDCIVDARQEYLDAHRSWPRRRQRIDAALNRCDSDQWEKLPVCMRDLLVNMDTAIDYKEEMIGEPSAALSWFDDAGAAYRRVRGVHHETAADHLRKHLAAVPKALADDCGGQPLNAFGSGGLATGVSGRSEAAAGSGQAN